MHRYLVPSVLLILVTLASALRGASGPILYTLVVPPSAEAGATVEVQIAALNTSGEATTVAWPAISGTTVTAASGHWSMDVRESEPAAASREIAAGAFALRRCVVTLPAATGPAVLELQVGAETLRAAVDLRPKPSASAVPAVVTGSPASPASPASQRPSTSLVQAKPAAAALRRVFADRLGPHEPIYFIYGPDAPAVKFQFSFKYKLLDFSELGEQRMLRSVHFAFTQRSLWDIQAASSPFYDTSYMPELIYESLAPEPAKQAGGQRFTWLGLQVAFKHESNGRDGPMSRSLNISYVRGAAAFGDLEGWHLIVAPEVWAYVDNLADNPDLKDYRGYGQLRLIAGRNDGPSLLATLWAGNGFKHKSVQLDLTFPVRTQRLRFETYLLIQYFDGYGESLRSYREHSQTVRAGFSLVR